MSAYRDFVDRLLMQLYRENTKNPGSYTRFDGAARDANLSPRRDWILRFTEETEGNGFAQVSKHLGNPADWHVRLKAAGAEYVEDVLGVTDEVDEVSSSGETSIKSSTWTGLPSSFELTEDLRVKIVSELERVEAALPDTSLSQQERSQVRAYVVAAKVLSEAPEPPSEIIWELVQRANNLSGIASLFVALFALFQ